MGKSFFTWAVILASPFVLGCGKSSGPATVSVGGTVYLDDKPLEGVEVNFFSQEENFLATGVTDASGKYTLYQGAVPGQNKVWISKVEASDANPAEIEENPELDPGQIEAMSESAEAVQPKEKAALPKKFSDPDQTVLKFTVPDGGTSSADFKLASE